jgi:cysteine desulfuration protein SufE
VRAVDGIVEGSLGQVQDRVVEEMAGLDRLAKYEYLVGLGQGLASPDGIRSDEYAVPGCQSRVWIQAELRDGRLRLFADSDAMITRGIIALLLRVLDGRPPAEVAHADLYFLEQTGLSTHLSPSRANGLAAMVKQIRTYAGEWDAG